MIRVVYFVIVLALFVLWNWYIIVKLKRSPNHVAQQVYRSVLWLFGAGLFCDGDNWVLVATLVGFHLAFWFPFDTALNVARGRAWNYQGQTSWLDVKLGPVAGVILPLKVLLMIAGIGFLIWPLGY